MNKRIFISAALASLVVFSANAGLWDKIKTTVSGSDTAKVVTEKATDAIASLSPEKAVQQLIEKCSTPTTDGICECVANEVLAGLNQDQWKTVNHYVFDTRRTVSLTDFLIKNPWLVTKIFNPYLKCQGKA